MRLATHYDPTICGGKIMPLTPGLLIAALLVGARVPSAIRSLKAIAPIVRRDDRSVPPVTHAWIFWDQRLTPWLAVTHSSPSDLQAMVAGKRVFDMPFEGSRVVCTPLVGQLPAEYVMNGGALEASLA
jgi:hypothetical protein